MIGTSSGGDDAGGRPSENDEGVVWCFSRSSTATPNAGQQALSSKCFIHDVVASEMSREVLLEVVSSSAGSFATQQDVQPAPQASMMRRSTSHSSAATNSVYAADSLHISHRGSPDCRHDAYHDNMSNSIAHAMMSNTSEQMFAELKVGATPRTGELNAILATAAEAIDATSDRNLRSSMPPEQPVVVATPEASQPEVGAGEEEWPQPEAKGVDEPSPSAPAVDGAAFDSVRESSRQSSPCSVAESVHSFSSAAGVAVPRRLSGSGQVARAQMEPIEEEIHRDVVFEAMLGVAEGLPELQSTTPSTAASPMPVRHFGASSAFDLTQASTTASTTADSHFVSSPLKARPLREADDIGNGPLQASVRGADVVTPSECLSVPSHGPDPAYVRSASTDAQMLYNFISNEFSQDLQLGLWKHFEPPASVAAEVAKDEALFRAIEWQL